MSLMIVRGRAEKAEIPGGSPGARRAAYIRLFPSHVCTYPHLHLTAATSQKMMLTILAFFAKAAILFVARFPL
jgi:hypothetical protein